MFFVLLLRYIRCRWHAEAESNAVWTEMHTGDRQNWGQEFVFWYFLIFIRKHTSLKKRILTSVCKRNVVTGSRLKDEVWRGKCFGLNFPPSRSDLIKAIKFIWISATQLYNGDNYISIKNFKLCITWRLAHNKPSHAWK